MLISEIAKLVNCHVESVRYYEKIGLIAKPDRNPNGYRKYNQQHLGQLKLIRKLKRLGFSQNEIREMLSLVNSNLNPCNDVRKLTANNLKKVNKKIKEYEQIKQILDNMRSSCESNDTDHCPILSELLENKKLT